MTAPIEEPVADPAAIVHYEVIAVNAAARTAEVRFYNPWHSVTNEFLVTREVQVGVNPSTNEPIMGPTVVDEDPNQHAVKVINVPVNADGSPDVSALTEILKGQRAGVYNRMLSAKDAQAAPLDGLDSLIGMNSMI